MRIGIHVRGFDSGRPVAVDRALERGAETIQIFASNPRQWRLPRVDPDADAQLLKEMAEHDVGPLFLHAPYLVNLASPADATREASMRTLEWTLRRAAELQAAGVVVHAGQTVGAPREAALRQVAKAICALLDSPTGPPLLLELTAGSKGAIASRLCHARDVLDTCGGHPRLALCLDTCHLFAAGYDLRQAGGVEELACQLASIGLDRLGLIHANDSRDGLGSGRDRHWHLGKGSIGAEGFRHLLRRPEVSNIPLICETPGQVEEDRLNIAWLKEVRDHAPAVVGTDPARGRDWVGHG